MNNSALPTSICSPTIISTLPPDDAPITASVATVRDITPITHRTKPNKSMPPCNRAPMIRTTPNSPASNPMIPKGRTRVPNTPQPTSATSSGMVDAMIAASDAGIVCIATKFRPRYRAF